MGFSDQFLFYSFAICMFIQSSKSLTLFYVILFIDSLSWSRQLMTNEQINNRTKYIDIKFQHICNCKKASDIASEHVVTDYQIADIMTKALGTENFILF